MSYQFSKIESENKKDSPSDICLIDLGAGIAQRQKRYCLRCPEVFLAVDLPSIFFRNSNKTKELVKKSKDLCA